MIGTSFFIFGLRGAKYAIPTVAVQETLWLPELTPVEEAPEFYSGLFNLRGKVVPVMDLVRRFGHAPQRFRLTDKVAVLNLRGRSLGLVVEAVYDVREIGEDQIEDAPDYGLNGGRAGRFVSGVAKLHQKLIGILDLDNLLGLPEQLETEEIGQDAVEAEAPEVDFFPEATPEERRVFRERADRLSRAEALEDRSDLTALAVVQIGGEALYLEMDGIREFEELGSVTPVPCCPAHIVGLINFRGEVVTLLDFRSKLDLAPGNSNQGKVAVVEVNDMLVGLLLDDVLDVTYEDADTLGPVPAAVKPELRIYLKGTLPYMGKLLGVLDLSRVLAEETWIVHEEL